ncbi:cation transport ATPase [Paenibacillus algicola]|uniref:Cd(2+)-exporting ATPase n=1 Tax=Paenibacillus algicola TaxID=2565926 RepID=A0A4P8XKL5_9BACL|nr:cation-translocating P-type ATPase [Paenibacillus algicola]QCT02883.1 cation transport ATPase [Paenibacillus algicola]
MNEEKKETGCCQDSSCTTKETVQPKHQIKVDLRPKVQVSERADACQDDCCTAAPAKAVESITPAAHMNASSKIRTYAIEGMDCGACAATIEKQFRGDPAVQSVSVNFSTGKMQMEHDHPVEEIIKRVSKAGFQATLLTKKQQKAPAAPTAKPYPLILSGVLLALGLISSFTGFSAAWSTFAYVLSILTGGYKPAKSAYYALKSRALDMNVLMTAAVVGAALIGEWLEGATVVWLFALGNMLQTASIERTRQSIRNLLDLAPPEAWVKEQDKLVKVPVEEMRLGQIIVIKPGDRIPLDGRVVVGESSVNQAPITGESIPVDKEIGDAVYAGTINEQGTLEVEVTALAEDTTISKIIHLVEEAQEKKAPTQAFVDRFAQIYTPIVFAAALLTMVLPPVIGLGSWGEWFYKGLELLVVACPCALVISTPVAIVSAIGNAAKHGVLIKGGAFLETAGRISAIAFDKTGTLTEGKPSVSHLEAWKVSEYELLSIAYTLEEYSTHPIAKAITAYAQSKGVVKQKGTGFNNKVGRGVEAEMNGTTYWAGNMKLFQHLHMPDSIQSKVQKLEQEGNTLVLIGTADRLLGLIAVSDRLRQVTVDALQGIRQTGVQELVMLTGDNEGTAKHVAANSGVSRYFAELMPEQKVSAIEKLQHEGHRVAMVGDGINDAPALAAADLGIAMGGAGTDTAMETADIVLMADNLQKLPHTIKLSRKALGIIKQNIWFSLIIKAAALVLIFPDILTLWIAVLSDTGAALLVILNSMRLLRVKG